MNEIEKIVINFFKEIIKPIVIMCYAVRETTPKPPHLCNFPPLI